MPHLRAALLAATAAVALAGLSASASAQSPRRHVMTISLPGGGTAQIRYTGDVPPRVVFGSAPAALADRMPTGLFGTESPFAMLDRISAEMDLQAAAMFRQAASLGAQAQSGQPIEAAIGNMPPGSGSYSYVSTISGNGVCTQSVEITSAGNGAAKVVRHSSGNCGPQTGGATGAAGSVNLPAARSPNRAPDTLWIKNSNPPPYRGLIQKTSAPQ